MPASGLFRVQQVKLGETPVNAEAERVRSRDCPA